MTIRIGDTVNVINFSGTYKVHQIFNDGVNITCKTWQARNNYLSKVVTKFIFFKQITTINGVKTNRAKYQIGTFNITYKDKNKNIIKRLIL